MRFLHNIKRLPRGVLLWGLLSIGLHSVLLLLLPGFLPPTTAGTHPFQLRVVAVQRAKFVPQRSSLPQVKPENLRVLPQKKPVLMSPPRAPEAAKPLPAPRPAVTSAVDLKPVIPPVAQTLEQKPAAKISEPVKTSLEAITPLSPPPEARNFSLNAQTAPPPVVVEMPDDFRDALPRYAENPFPVYPQLARRNGWQGQVLLQVAVTSDGKVKTLNVEKSSGFRILDRAALRAVKNWRFFPARKAGRAVVSEVLVPIEFHLSQAI